MLVQKIVNTVKRNSYLDYEPLNSTDTLLSFSTRENGDGVEEVYSSIDLEEAIKVEKILIKEFGNKIKINVEPVDEWVIMEVEIL